MIFGIIGYGYWGKILHKNISELYPNSTIHIYDLTLEKISNYDLKKCNKIFIATPATTHRELADIYLSSGIDVFCEKPLAVNRADVYALYKIAENNNSKLFVDWTFTFNSAINYIKNEYNAGTYGNLLSVRMNRINKGPSRADVSAKWDLASHDVSILQYIFNSQCLYAMWNTLRRSNKNCQDDTCVGVLKYSTFDAILYSSWEYSQKNRDCIFEFEKGILFWDDITQKIVYNGQEVVYNTEMSPLKKAIHAFVEEDYDQKQLTIDVTNILLMNY